MSREAFSLHTFLNEGESAVWPAKEGLQGGFQDEGDEQGGLAELRRSLRQGRAREPLPEPSRRLEAVEATMERIASGGRPS
jgi:hypothetical protein